MSFGEQLISKKLIGARGLEEATEFCANFGGSIAQAVLKLGLAREQDVLRCWADFIGIPYLSDMKGAAPQRAEVEAAAKYLGLSPSWLARRGAAIWLRPVDAPDQIMDEVALNAAISLERELVLMLLAREPLNTGLHEEIGRRWQGQSQNIIGSNRILDALLAGLTDEALAEDARTSLAHLRELAEEAPVIDFVNGLFSDALELDASDVHIEPGPENFLTRFRVDGVLGHPRPAPMAIFDSVSTRVKILSGMDIAERRLPQDGRQSVRLAGEEVDLRVSSLPGTYGESLVLRILRKKSELPNLKGLGMDGRILNEFTSLIGMPNGIVLVTGPTGSGKSTTLYRALESLNDGASKIITIEDPVEYEISGVNQVHARAEIGLTFAAGLRATLRQDPDIIMVGEIRDKETAIISVQAALTGHLVFSTLHTNSAQGVVERLIDLGVDPFLISASLRGAIGQRLLRRLCPDCREPDNDKESHQKPLRHLNQFCPQLLPSLANDFHIAGAGCPACGHSGYRGRIGAFEIINFTAFADSAQELNERLSLANLRQYGYTTMLEDALLKAGAGHTSMAEITRVFGQWAQ